LLFAPGAVLFAVGPVVRFVLEAVLPAGPVLFGVPATDGLPLVAAAEFAGVADRQPYWFVVPTLFPAAGPGA
jgi:hypothetical protein